MDGYTRYTVVLTQPSVVAHDDKDDDTFADPLLHNFLYYYLGVRNRRLIVQSNRRLLKRSSDACYKAIFLWMGKSVHQSFFVIFFLTIANGWRNNAYSSLAEIVLLDQFTRNIFRDDPKAFSADDLALEATKNAIDKGFDQELRKKETME